MKELQINPALSLPISLDIHVILLLAGYKLKNQELLHLEYETTGKRLCFNFATGVKYEVLYEDQEDDRGPHWSTMFEARINYAIDPIAFLDILHTVNAINYFKIPEARNAISKALEAIRTKGKIQPLTPSQLKTALTA